MNEYACVWSLQYVERNRFFSKILLCLHFLLSPVSSSLFFFSSSFFLSFFLALCVFVCSFSPLSLWRHREVSCYSIAPKESSGDPLLHIHAYTYTWRLSIHYYIYVCIPTYALRSLQSYAKIRNMFVFLSSGVSSFLSNGDVWISFSSFSFFSDHRNRSISFQTFLSWDDSLRFSPFLYIELQLYLPFFYGLTFNLSSSSTFILSLLFLIFSSPLKVHIPSLVFLSLIPTIILFLSLSLCFFLSHSFFLLPVICMCLLLGCVCVCRVGQWSLYGVFDGHGPYGHDVSHYVQRELPAKLLLYTPSPPPTNTTTTEKGKHVSSSSSSFLSSPLRALHQSFITVRAHDIQR